MATTTDILRKISYIEADIEIHRQILFSLPSNQPGEIEKTIAAIATKKGEIQSLREEIRTQDPAAHSRIVAFEQVSAEFRQRVLSGGYTKVVSGFDGGEESTHTLPDGSNCPCLVKAFDPAGNWILITPAGELLKGDGVALIP